MKSLAIYETVFHPVTCENCKTEYRWLVRKTHDGESFYVKGFLEKADADQFRTKAVEDWKKAQRGLFSLLFFHVREYFSTRHFPNVPDKEKYEWQVYRNHPILVIKAQIVEPGDQPGRVVVKSRTENFSWLIFCCEEVCGCVAKGMADDKEDAFYEARIHIDTQLHT